jgi:hypothetical protein
MDLEEEEEGYISEIQCDGMDDVSDGWRTADP